MNSKYLFRIIAFISFLALSFIQVSCKKLVEVEAPVTSINADNVYSTEATAISVLTGIYATMSFNDQNFTGNSSISVLGGLSADEFSLFNAADEKYLAYYSNSLVSNLDKAFGTDHWTSLYQLVFTCNAAIEGVEKSNTLRPAIKTQLLGEAKFMRAFFFFYLVNLYGEVPLTTTTDYKINSTISRSLSAEVYVQIVSDLKEAIALLDERYLDATLEKITGDRVRPNRSTARALLARVYLFTKDWVNAELEASAVINRTDLFGLSDVATVFLRSNLGNNESIWQLQPVRNGWNTEDAKTFIIPTTGPANNPVHIQASLLENFEQGDLRRVNWIDSVIVGVDTIYYPFKYKDNILDNPVTEHLTMLRLAEQYLIRAEARAHNNDISGAQSDLNVIRQRAGLPITSASNQDALLDEIMHERQVELFSEFAHRWLDLKRTETIDQVMSIRTPLKNGLPWQSNQQLYPVPFTDIQMNRNLSQNPGY